MHACSLELTAGRPACLSWLGVSEVVSQSIIRLSVRPNTADCQSVMMRTLALRGGAPAAHATQEDQGTVARRWPHRRTIARRRRRDMRPHLAGHLPVARAVVIVLALGPLRQARRHSAGSSSRQIARARLTCAVQAHCTGKYCICTETRAVVRALRCCRRIRGSPQTHAP